MAIMLVRLVEVTKLRDCYTITRRKVQCFSVRRLWFYVTRNGYSRFQIIRFKIPDLRHFSGCNIERRRDENRGQTPWPLCSDKFVTSGYNFVTDGHDVHTLASYDYIELESDYIAQVIRKKAILRARKKRTAEDIISAVL
ncbi:hypothetical protein PanWU01x14_079700 [Parasponia andersonii]|uniref:Uncharacterized protein n=1 Tax=Parasponia andersonii TaxID=3476 RepID=A0A2P5DBC6_PARAD|nr:hypothetical protein PanWU01x14_079700 [Parasponia andersonii]